MSEIYRPDECGAEVKRGQLANASIVCVPASLHRLSNELPSLRSVDSTRPALADHHCEPRRPARRSDAWAVAGPHDAAISSAIRRRRVLIAAKCWDDANVAAAWYDGRLPSRWSAVQPATTTNGLWPASRRLVDPDAAARADEYEQRTKIRIHGEHEHDTHVTGPVSPVRRRSAVDVDVQPSNGSRCEQLIVDGKGEDQVKIQ